MSRYLQVGGAAAALFLLGCGSWGRVGSQPAPGAEAEAVTQVLDLASVYR